MSVNGQPQAQPGLSRAVLCPKCQTPNTPERARCTACGADLLPGRSGRERLGILATGIIGATLFVLLAAYLASKDFDVPICISPPGLVLYALAGFIGSLRLGLGRTAPWQKYLDRAQRHLDPFPEQALADLTKALESAPESRKSAIQKQRGELLSKLGRGEQALEALSEYVAAPTPSDGARMLGRFSDIEIEPSADAATLAEVSRLQRQLVESGARQWIGYCLTCRTAVPVDVDKRCPRCDTTLKEVRLVRPEERDLALAKLNREQSAGRRNRRLGIAVAAVAVFACIVLPLVAVLMRPKTETARATPTPRPAATAATPGVFRESVFSFRYPQDWQRIGPPEVSTLLKTSLKGLQPGGYSYIGGVFTEGLDNCKGCAQIVLVVARNADLPGTLTEAQYHSFRQASEQAMGSRLLLHRMTQVSSLPAAESIHLGLSGDAKLWEFIIVPPLAGQAYMVSCSSHKDSFAAFEPVFQDVIHSLSIAFGTPTPAPTATRTPTPAPPTVVTYTVKSGDVLGQIAKDLGVTLEAIIEANNITDPNLIQPGQVLTIPLATR